MGIFTLVFPPSIVGASKSPPNAAVVIVIGIRQKRLFPSLSKIECFSTSINIYKSPDCPPLIPASPSPESQKSLVLIYLKVLKLELELDLLVKVKQALEGDNLVIYIFLLKLKNTLFLKEKEMTFFVEYQLQ
jgi:hypothetical protein